MPVVMDFRFTEFLECRFRWGRAKEGQRVFKTIQDTNFTNFLEPGLGRRFPLDEDCPCQGVKRVVGKVADHQEQGELAEVQDSFAR